MFKGAVMSITYADASQLWTVGLFLAVALVALSAVAICIFMWRNRPEREDSVRHHKIEKRLAEIALPVTEQRARSA
jgi:hypothetical protein